MYLEVLGEVIGAGEPLVTEFTLVGLHPGVRPLVSRQFIRPGEPPATTRPGTGEGLLSSVSPEVRLKV